MADPTLLRVVTEVSNSVVIDTEDRVRAIWNALDDLSDEAGQRAIDAVVPTVGAGQRTLVDLNTTYLNRVTGTHFLPPEVALLIPEATWNRSPLIQARRLMSEGAELAAALADAANRAAQVHTGDLFRARSDALAVLGGGLDQVRPVRWAKMPGPNACEWCRTVSTRLYSRADSIPVHLNDRCPCNAITPQEDMSGYTNAGTIWGNEPRWRSRISSQELRDIQLRMAADAQERAAQATQSMFSQAA